jgi:hypothetical protein
LQLGIHTVIPTYIEVDVTLGIESVFTTFGGVPDDVLMDNPRALVVRHDAVSRSVQFNDKLIAFAKHGASVLSPARRIGHARRARRRAVSGT